MAHQDHIQYIITYKNNQSISIQVFNNTFTKFTASFVSNKWNIYKQISDSFRIFYTWWRHLPKTANFHSSALELCRCAFHRVPPGSTKKKPPRCRDRFGGTSTKKQQRSIHVGFQILQQCDFVKIWKKTSDSQKHMSCHVLTVVSVC